MAISWQQLYQTGFKPGRDVVHFTPSDERKKSTSSSRTVSSSSSSSSSSTSGVASGQSFENIIGGVASGVLSAASSLDAYMTGAFEESLNRLMPDWRQQVFGTAGQTMSDINHLTELFRKGLPSMMARVDEVSTQALTQVSSMLRGELPADVAAQVQRHAAEVSNQMGVRGQAAQNLTARDLGRTAFDMITTGLQYAPTATTLATTAYGQAQNVLAMPMNAAATLGNMLTSMRAPQTDVSALFANVLPQAVNQSQFQTDTINTNYWNRVNQSLGQQAVNTSNRQLQAAMSYNNQMLQLSREQMQMTKSLQTAAAGTLNNGSSGGSSGRVTVLG